MFLTIIELHLVDTDNGEPQNHDEAMQVEESRKWVWCFELKEIKKDNKALGGLKSKYKWIRDIIVIE